MEALCIETENTNPELLRKRLLQQIESWRSSGLLQEFNEISTGTITIWDCRAGNNSQAKNLRRLAAQVLADYIVSEIEPVLLDKLASVHHPHFGKEEREQICQKVRQRLVREEALTGESRRHCILKRLDEFLKDEEQINIEGFIRFRLQDYQRELLQLLNESADDFIIEKEYQEFINLLRYFVDIQPPRFPEMHLFRKNNYLILCDSRYTELHREGACDLEGSDAIISALVTAAPKKVTIHNGPAEDELVATLRHIFADRIQICLGCPRCRDGNC
ncbi:MAG: hypothetical protein GX090_02605 [Firmicutes bacterium]|nr:hypothetical protein [Bacillota bacterium]HOB35359.1 putative sporulation protein YtxC [Bacillota bacterium]HPZ91107.1 putative sporulation protein YtxC [Bacillota bacterium]HQE01691.1 putative sporulation protein YtxC [Bacillota bacterium]